MLPMSRKNLKTGDMLIGWPEKSISSREREAERKSNSDKRAKLNLATRKSHQRPQFYQQPQREQQTNGQSFNFEAARSLGAKFGRLGLKVDCEFLQKLVRATKTKLNDADETQAAKLVERRPVALKRSQSALAAPQAVKQQAGRLACSSSFKRERPAGRPRRADSGQRAPLPDGLSSLRSMAAAACNKKAKPGSSSGLSKLFNWTAPARRRRGRTISLMGSATSGTSKLLFALLAQLALLVLLSDVPGSHCTPIWSRYSPLAQLNEADDVGQQVPDAWTRRMVERGPFTLDDEETLPLPDDRFWVERRRLNRDRALEPAAWNRARPIRRDGEPARPIGRRLNRARQSAEDNFYADLLASLLEQALDGRTLLEELQAEQTGTHRQSAARPGAPQAATSAAAASAPADQIALDSKEAAQTGELVLAGDEMIHDADQSDQLDSEPEARSAELQAESMPPAPLGEQVATGELGLLGSAPQASTGGADSAAEAGDTFHVVEDIDQVDSGREIGPAQAGDEPPAARQQQKQQAGWRAAMVRRTPVEQPEVAGEAANQDKGEERREQQQQEAGAESAGSRDERSAMGAVVAVSGANPLLATAMAMVRSSSFTRDQLMRFATRLRVYLENLLALPRGAILGLFPINTRQLLIELDLGQLSASERASLMEMPGYAHGSSALVLTWPAGGARATESPIPLLMAILEALYLDEFKAPDEKKLAPWPSAGRINELELELGREPDSEPAGVREAQLASAPMRALLAYLNAAGQLDPAVLASPRLRQTLVEQLGQAQTQAGLELLRARASAAEMARPPAAAWAERLFGPVLALAPAAPPSQPDAGLSGRGAVRVAALLLLALASVCLLVKLATLRLDRQFVRNHLRHADDTAALDDSAACETKQTPGWHFNWGRRASQSSATIEGKTGQAGAAGMLAEAQVGARGIPSRVLRNSRKLLAQRWARFAGNRTPGLDVECGGKEAPCEQQQEAEAAEVKGNFRSSTSYVRSLIEALTKAASQQMAPMGGKRRVRALAGGRGQPEAANEDDDDELDTECGSSVSSAGGDKSRQKFPADEVLVSQMDISAAHLILDYMEEHLVDKERLRREWLELTAASEASATKANQLVLQRLAKTALAEPNLAKNRDPRVVPFDRNRVRLGAKFDQHNQTNNNNNTNGRRADAAKAEENIASDYVNASFIYDSDQRRPTHIVAQGPTGGTCGQFWQMIWEQEICTIVMLTRLNENGQQLCHCYWPTKLASAGQTGAMSGRRNSVTSVFNGAAPIVTSAAELDDNALCFQPHPRLKLQVHLVSEHVSSSDYLVRNMFLMNATTGETRTISQFHYLAWPAGATPDNVRSFLQFRRKVRKSYRNPSSPILVHCSDGAGRSGTYVLIDTILERVKMGAKEIDLRATLEHLRHQRAGLCETQGQFEFVLVALAEEIQIILNALPH